MTLSLTDDQWKSLGDTLFLLQPAATTKLTRPTIPKAGSGLATKLDFLKTDPLSKDYGIVVVDMTAGLLSPVLWMNNETAAWRAGSTAKITILLAAVQLRDDVRVAQKLVPKAADLDELFASPRLWKMGKDPRLKAIAGKHHAPRISTIFNLSGAQAEFFGPDADKPDIAGINTHLNNLTSGEDHPGHLSRWAYATDFDFSERLWLAGAKSDNLAAASCISEIGLPYLKAVQRAYGLFDPPNGMKLMLGGMYPPGWVDTSVPVSNDATTTYRSLETDDVEHNKVTDAVAAKAGSTRFDDQNSWQSVSAVALAAYLIALMQEDLVAFGHGLSAGAIGCKTIRANLSPGIVGTTKSFITKGVASADPAPIINKQMTKIGLLGTADLEPGPLNCEFAYVETTESTGTTPKKMKYGVLVTGITSQTQGDGTIVHAANVTMAIGRAIHEKLAAP